VLDFFSFFLSSFFLLSFFFLSSFFPSRHLFFKRDIRSTGVLLELIDY